MRLTKLRLKSYKGFRNYTCTFAEGALLLGPNNAGKSTIIDAVRLADAAASVTVRSKPQRSFRDGQRTILGYGISRLPDRGFNLENIRHEFQDRESRLELTYSSDTICHVVWPADDPAFFWLEHKGTPVMTASAAKQLLTPIGWVPTLAPLENQEKRLSAEHLTKHVDTPLSSRHFRNNLRLLREEDPTSFAAFIRFALENTPELQSLDLVVRRTEGEEWLDLFYVESGARTEKEVNWAGDGLQIWLQILFHLHRNSRRTVIGLDEPDVFLHPDLQRRLVRVLEGTNAQVLMASHAAEVASEADASRLVWIDRTGSHAKRVMGVADLETVTNSLGTSFNLAIAKALRSKLALFVEGEDMKILRVLADRIGLSRLATEDNLAVIPIGGFSHWPGVEAFSWLKNAFLGGSVDTWVVLDRDYRSEKEVQEIEEKLDAGGVRCHIWKRKELESYLLDPEILAAASGVVHTRAVDILMECSNELRFDVFGQFDKAFRMDAEGWLDPATVSSNSWKSFEEKWSLLESRLRWAPAKKIINCWNAAAVRNNTRVITARRLASVATEELLDEEMVSVLQDIDERLL